MLICDSFEIYPTWITIIWENDEITCDQIGVVELANRISLVPGNSISEIAVEHGKTFLGQHPRIADVHLQIKRKWLTLLGL